MDAGAAASSQRPDGSTSVYFAVSSAKLDEAALKELAGPVAALADSTRVAQIAGYVDASGSAARNVALAKARARAVGQALSLAGVAPARIHLVAPANIVGGGAPDQARRVDITIGAAK